MDQHNENLKNVLSTITPALLSGKNGELWSTNKKVISTHIDPHKLFGRYMKKLIREWRLGMGWGLWSRGGMLQSYYPKTGYPGTRSNTRRVVANGLVQYNIIGLGKTL